MQRAMLRTMRSVKPIPFTAGTVHTLVHGFDGASNLRPAYLTERNMPIGEPKANRFSGVKMSCGYST